ncbi:MAG: hypothetical protein J5695_07470, partial [Bacteroidales bacterium]|nr:hypothetical protein [Bacteroidales bacterium]
MIRTLCIFLPLFTCVLWLIAHRLFCRRIDTAPQLFSLLLFESLFLFYDCCYADVLAPKHLQAISVLMAQAATPCLVPLCIIYLRKLRGIRTSHPLHLLWAVLPAALLTSAIIFYILAGPDNIEHALQAYYSGGLKAIDALSGDVTYLFFLSAFYVYRIVVYVLVVLFVFYLVFYYRKCSFKAADLHNFFFKSGDVPVCQLQFFNLSLLYAFMAVKALIIKDLVNSHPWSIVFFSVAMTVLIYSFCYIAMFGARQTIRISDLGDAWRYNYGTDSKGEVLARMLNSQIDESGDEAIILL